MCTPSAEQGGEQCLSHTVRGTDEPSSHLPLSYLFQHLPNQPVVGTPRPQNRLCPTNCQQCRPSWRCLKCRNGYRLRLGGLMVSVGWPSLLSSPCCLVRPTHAVFWRQPEAYYISACLHLETCHALCLLHPSLDSARRFEGGRRLCQGQPRRQQAEGAAPSTKAHIRPLQARQTPPTPMT